MGWSDGEKERERLGAMYGEMGDGELLGLHVKARDLTDVAQEALSAEVKRRGLVIPIEDVEEGTGVSVSRSDSGWKTLHVFSQTFEAQAAFRLLERNGIEFAVEDRTVDENGELREGPAVQLALMVEAQDWDRAVTLLRREAGLFPVAVVDPYGEDESTEAEMGTVGEFEDPRDVAAASHALEANGLWFRTVLHDHEEWKRTSIEVRAEDVDRALDALEKLLEGDASTL